MSLRNKLFIIIPVIAVVIITGLMLWLFVFRNETNSNNMTDEEIYTYLREKMVDTQMVDRAIYDRNVIKAMRTVPRHLFVRADSVPRAYDDTPISIGLGQTISQPYIVALMTELLELKKNDRVLEIGTGSGYQAAVLAEISSDVYTVEIIKELYDFSGANLSDNGYTGLHTSNHDGYYGWEEYAPFDKIIVTAAPDHIPQPLIEQLKDGGIMIIPVGPPGWGQILWKVTKEDGEVFTEEIADVCFVTLTRDVR